MINIFIKSDEMYIKTNEDIFYYNFKELEKELESILEYSNLEKNSKIKLILDYDAYDIEMYISIFDYYNINIKKAIYFIEVLKELNKEIVYIGKSNSIIISNNKVEEISLKISDDYDYTGIETLIINQDSIDKVFDMIEKSKSKNIIKQNYDILYILAFMLLLIFLAYYLSIYFYNIQKIDVELNDYNKELTILKEKIRDKNDILKDLESKIQKYNKMEYIELSRIDTHKLILYLINLTNKSYKLKEIEYKNNILFIDGNVDSFFKMNKDFEDAEIIYLKSDNNELNFRLKTKMYLEENTYENEKNR